MKRDFSDSAQDEIIKLMNEVGDEKSGDFTDWFGDGWYEFQEWLGSLNIDHYIGNVYSYQKKVIEKNNASKSTIDTIFNDVKNIDQNYATRFAAYKTCLEQFCEVIGQFVEVVSPTNGSFDPGKLDSYISKYEKTEKYLKILAGEGLSEANINEIDDITMATIVEGIVSTVVDLLPNIKAGEAVEIPVGPEVAIYYSVKASTIGDSDLDLEAIIEDQKIKLKNISVSKDLSGFKIKMNTDGEINGTISSDFDSNNNKKINVSLKGLSESSISVKDGNDTYTVTNKYSLEKVAFEESIKTEMGAGSVTSTIGLKKENQIGWAQLPVPVVEAETVTLPKFKVSNVNWEVVLESVIETAAISAIIAGIVLLTVETGGACLFVLAMI